MAERDDVVLPERPKLCSRCGRAVDRCAVCGLGFPLEQAVTCRDAAGHEHEACTAHRMKKARRSNPV